MSTIAFAKFFGVFLTIFSLGLLFNQDHVKKALDSASKNPGLNVISTVIPMLFGLYIVMTMCSWVGFPAIMVSIVGWVLLVTSVMRCWFTSGCMNFMSKCDCLPKVGSTILLIFGILLILAGFFS